MPFAQTLLDNAESNRANDSDIIGQNILRNTLTAENKKEIEADMHLYPDNKGVGRHTSLDFQIIVEAVSEEWKVLGGESPVTSLEMLARYKVRTGLNAHKFIGFVYTVWPQDTKLEFAKSNLRTRGKSSLNKVNINMLPGLWSQLVNEETEASKLVFKCVRPTDFPEIQEFGDDGKILRGPHSEETKAGIRCFCKKTGGKVSVDDWNLDDDYCNSTALLMRCCFASRR